MDSRNDIAARRCRGINSHGPGAMLGWPWKARHSLLVTAAAAAAVDVATASVNNENSMIGCRSN